MRIEPTFINAYMVRGILKCGSNDNAGGATDFREYLKRKPDSSQVHAYLSGALRQMNANTEADKEARISAELKAKGK